MIKNYKSDDVWHKRQQALEAFARNRIPKTAFYPDLWDIAKRDGDWRIRKLAQSMISSYLQEGDFSQTRPYQEKLAEIRRKAIKTTCKKTTYNPNDLWYFRLEEVSSMGGSTYRGPAVIQDLTAISERDDDWRIRREATRLLRGCVIKLPTGRRAQ